MTRKSISSGTVHKTPKELVDLFQKNISLGAIWEDITPLARNEWICWITSAKKDETRDRRIMIMKDKLKRGERRPCCWAGCPHRG